MRKAFIALMLCIATAAFAHRACDAHYDGSRLLSRNGRVVSLRAS